MPPFESKILFSITIIAIKIKRMKYRSKTDIFSNILETASGSGAVKTKIMYQVFISHDQMKGYLSFLTERGLLNYDLDTRKFKTTEKGKRFLQIYNQIDDMIKLPLIIIIQKRGASHPYNKSNKAILAIDVKLY